MRLRLLVLCFLPFLPLLLLYCWFTRLAIDLVVRLAGCLAVDLLVCLTDGLIYTLQEKIGRCKE